MIKSRRFAVKELTGKERMFLQICHNIWKWIKDGHGASSFFETEQAEVALSDIEKIMGKRGMQAENIILALYDRVDDLAFKIDREKRLNNPEVQKAMTEIDGLAGNHDSTRLGRIIAEEIAEDMGIKKASLAVRKGNWKYSSRTPIRRSFRRKASTEWWHGIEGAWFGGSKYGYGQYLFYRGIPIEDSDSFWERVQDDFDSICEERGLENTEESFDEWLNTSDGIDSLESTLMDYSDAEFNSIQEKMGELFSEALINVRKQMNSSDDDEWLHSEENIAEYLDEFNALTTSDRWRIPGKAMLTKDMAETLNVRTDEDKIAFIEAIQDRSLKDVFDVREFMRYF